MPKFRKKPVVIEAIEWNGHGFALREMPQWFIDAYVQRKIGRDDERLRIHTLEGIMTAQPGDWIVRGVMGELYPCKPDIFAATYEPVEEG